jgi:hypothetical protein
MSTAIEVVTGYLRALSGSDPDDIASFVSDSFRNEHLSELGSGCTGRVEYRRRLPNFLASFGDRSYEVEDIVEQVRESSTDVVVRYRLRANYADGPIADAPIEIPGVMWFSVHDDQISKRVDVWDSLTFLQQTGQVPRP